MVINIAGGGGFKDLLTWCVRQMVSKMCFFKIYNTFFCSPLFIIYGVILVILDGGFNESFSSPQNLGLYDLIQLGHFCNID